MFFQTRGIARILDELIEAGVRADKALRIVQESFRLDAGELARLKNASKYKERFTHE